jgi:hypothetical protein
MNFQKGFVHATVLGVLVLLIAIIFGGVIFVVSKNSGSKVAYEPEKSNFEDDDRAYPSEYDDAAHLSVTQLASTNGFDNGVDFSSPKKIDVVNGRTFTDRIEAYGAFDQIFIGPNGWTGDGSMGANGNTFVELYPFGGSANIGSHFTFIEYPACVGCILSAAGKYFPSALKEYNESYNVDGRNPLDVPEGLQVTPISTTLVRYSYPDINDTITAGVAYFDKNSYFDRGYKEMRITFGPELSGDLVNFLIQTYIRREYLE